MLKTAYHISLKGYVGGYDFDRSTVDRDFAKNEGKQVNVLIDSLGGSLVSGLSISAAFKNHGNVNVHFVGLLLPQQPSLPSVFHTFIALPGGLSINHHKITPSLKFSPYNLSRLFSLVFQRVNTCQVVILMQ